MTQPLPVLPTPHTILFDWHGTLVDTQEAMMAAMEEMMSQMEDLALVERLVPESECKTDDDVKLVRYIRIFRRLHPKILLEKRSSRTEIFKAIFGDDSEAKALAHRAYNKAYRSYYGKVRPFQEGIREYLSAMQRLGLNLGVATNRSREFLQHELRTVDDGSWPQLLRFTTCADDVTHYKPDPQVIRYALASIDKFPKPDTWYIGDSATDMETARRAGVTPILFNSACRDHEELWASFDHGPAGKRPAVRPGGLLQDCQQGAPAAVSGAQAASCPCRTGLASVCGPAGDAQGCHLRLARDPGRHPGCHVSRRGRHAP
jgi:phosphoglycolate phosphatase